MLSTASRMAYDATSPGKPQRPWILYEDFIVEPIMGAPKTIRNMTTSSIISARAHGCFTGLLEDDLRRKLMGPTTHISIPIPEPKP